MLATIQSRIQSSHVLFENFNFACGSVWVWNLVSDIKGGTQTGGVWEQGVEDNIRNVPHFQRIHYFYVPLLTQRQNVLELIFMTLVLQR
jgi:hypothetical protein